jgi:adenine-specific DNA-methyltransferase
MIKYLGSKRRLVPVLTELIERSGATTALDLFTGTTRVAQAFKRAGAAVTAVDTARYAEMFARTWIELDGDAVDRRELADAVAELDALPGEPGYVTDTFCTRARSTR